MRWNRLLISTAAALAGFAVPGFAAAFGSVVPLVGHAADIALDEARGRLYIANFTANRIEVLNTATNALLGPINVPSQPGSIALSPDGQYLVVTNYANWGTNTPPVGANLVTILDLVNNSRMTYSTGDPALSVAFVSYGSRRSGMALIATTTSFYLLDPANGTLTLIDTVTNLAKQLAVPQATFPGQVTQAAMATAADGVHVWGVADATTGTQLIYLFDSNTGRMTSQVWTTTPPLLPRVTAAADGSWAMIGWAVYTRAQCGGGFMIRSRHPDAIQSANITGHAADSRNNILYAQVADPSQPAGPPFAANKLPYFAVMDADNLTVRDKIQIAENMVGRALLNKGGTTMYAISDSGVMVLPVGSLSRARRLTVSTEDMLLQTNFCNRTSLKQTFRIEDVSGGAVDFSIAASQGGVSVSPSTGTTPATITVTVDPAAFQNTFSTLAVNLTVQSTTAVNLPRTVRVLLSNPDQDQRGSIVNVPGVLTDVLADTARNRFYVVRQDTNEVLVFDGGNNQLRARLRTGLNQQAADRHGAPGVPEGVQLGGVRRRRAVGQPLVARGGAAPGGLEGGAVVPVGDVQQLVRVLGTLQQVDPRPPGRRGFQGGSRRCDHVVRPPGGGPQEGHYCYWHRRVPSVRTHRQRKYAGRGVNRRHPFGRCCPRPIS
jgi:DNA-binding beta-propeller fold protein YncE